MPKPQGTFLRIRANAKSAAVAEADKKKLAVPRNRQREKVYELLDKIPESRLKMWQKEMERLRAAIAKSEPLAKEDKVRKAVSEVIGEVRKVAERIKEDRTFQATIQRPAEVIVRAPTNLGGDGAVLALVIALCQILEVLVKLRGNKSKRE